MIIYKITNQINGKVYIGKTTVLLSQRWAKHLSQARKYKNHPLYDSINHYGVENFLIESIDTALDAEDLSKKEIYWIEKYNARNRDFGYNLYEGGFGMTSDDAKRMWQNPEYRLKASERSKKRRHTQETIEKIRLSNLGRKSSDKTKEKLSKKAILRWLNPDERKKQSDKHKGKVLSEEHKQNIGQSCKGLKRTDETKNKISNGLKGKPKSEEHKEKLRGRIFTEEHKKNISISKKNISEETRKKMSESAKKRIVSDETKKRLSEIRKGKSFSENHKKSLVEAWKKRKEKFKSENN